MFAFWAGEQASGNMSTISDIQVDYRHSLATSAFVPKGWRLQATRRVGLTSWRSMLGMLATRTSFKTLVAPKVPWRLPAKLGRRWVLTRRSSGRPKLLLGLAKKADGQGQQPNEAAPHGEEPQQAGDTICSGGRECLIHRNNMLSHRWMRSISALTGHYFWLGFSFFRCLKEHVSNHHCRFFWKVILEACACW